MHCTMGALCGGACLTGSARFQVRKNCQGRSNGLEARGQDARGLPLYWSSNNLLLPSAVNVFPQRVSCMSKSTASPGKTSPLRRNHPKDCGVQRRELVRSYLRSFIRPSLPRLDSSVALSSLLVTPLKNSMWAQEQRVLPAAHSAHSLQTHLCHPVCATHPEHSTDPWRLRSVPHWQQNAAEQAGPGPGGTT